MGYAAVRSKTAILLLLICYSAVVPCFALRCVVSFYVCLHLNEDVRMRELDGLLSLSSWCLVVVMWLFLMVP